MTKKVSLLAIVLTLSLIAPAAHAHFKVDVDGNDSPSPLDIRLAAVGHTRRALVGLVKMQRSFRNAALGNKGDVFVDFDSRGTGRPDYYVCITHDRRLKASVWKYSGNTAVRVGSGRAFRYRTKWVGFRFPMRFLNRSGGFIRFYASSRYFRGLDDYGDLKYYWDSAPNRGMVSHAF